MLAIWPWWVAVTLPAVTCGGSPPPPSLSLITHISSRRFLFILTNLFPSSPITFPCSATLPPQLIQRYRAGLFGSRLELSNSIQFRNLGKSPQGRFPLGENGLIPFQLQTSFQPTSSPHSPCKPHSKYVLSYHVCVPTSDYRKIKKSCNSYQILSSIVHASALPSTFVFGSAFYFYPWSLVP